MSPGAPLGDLVERDNDHEIDGGGNRQERDHIVDQVAVQKVALVDGEGEILEVRLAENGSDQRGQDVGDKGFHHCGERGADHDGDRQIDDVAPENKFLETLQNVGHSALPPSPGAPGFPAIVGRTVATVRQVAMPA